MKKLISERVNLNHPVNKYKLEENGEKIVP